MSAGQPTTSEVAATPWSKYMLDLYTSRRPPPLGTLYIQEIEELARHKLKDRTGLSTLWQMASNLNADDPGYTT